MIVYSLAWFGAIVGLLNGITFIALLIYYTIKKSKQNKQLHLKIIKFDPYKDKLLINDIDKREYVKALGELNKEYPNIFIEKTNNNDIVSRFIKFIENQYYGIIVWIINLRMRNHWDE